MNCLKFIGKIFILCSVLLEVVSSTAQNYKAADGREYLIEADQKYNWYQAVHECARKDSQLVVIDSAVKNTAIIDLLKKVVGKPQNLWLGGNDEYNSTTKYDRPFYWSATGQKFNFSFWSENNPDNYQSQEHCVHIYASKPNFQWNDNACTNTFGFICEVNHYLEKYENDIKNKCSAVKETTSVISQEFAKTQKIHLNGMDLQLKKTESMVEKFKIELQKLQNVTHVGVQKLIDQQQIQVQLLSSKIFQRVEMLSVELKKSISVVDSQFAEKLNAKQIEMSKTC